MYYINGKVTFEQSLEGDERLKHSGCGRGLESWGAFKAEGTASAKALSVAELHVSWRLEWQVVSEGPMGQMVDTHLCRYCNDLREVLQDFEPRSDII